jgi:hypothetical protein
MAGQLLIALTLTILIEFGVLWLLMERRRKVLALSVVINVLTNVPLNLVVMHVGYSTMTVLIGELIVLFVEALWYLIFIRDVCKAFIYSLLCNAVSFLIGLLGQTVCTYLLTQNIN